MKHPETIVEKIIVLALHPTKAYWIIPKQKVNIGIVGAAMLDMCELKELEIKNKRVFTKTLKSTLSEGHSYFLQKIKDKSQNRKIKRWIVSFNRFPSRYRWLFFNEMARKGIISIQSHSFLFIPYKRIRLIAPPIKVEIVKQIHTLLENEKVDQNDAALLSMVLALKLFKPFGSNFKDRMAFKKLLKRKVESNPISSEVDEAIREMQAAVAAATIAASAGATAAGGGS
jgi:hypothetical protein